MKGIIRFFYDEEGLTVVEYVIGAALLVVALVFIFITLENGLISSFSNTMDYVQNR